MKKVAVVTGASGYTGMHLCKLLLDNGWDVHVIVRSSSDTKRLMDLTNNRVVMHVYTDGTDNLPDIFQSVQPDVVYHLASMVTSANDYRIITPLLISNIVFSTRIIGAMLQAGCKKLVNASTSWVHYNQNVYNPVCLYAATKQAFIDILRFYQEAHGLKVITLELFDSFGADDYRAKLLNLIRNSVCEGKIMAATQGMQKISLLYIDDLVRGFLVAGNQLMENRDVCGCYVLPAEEIVTIRQLVDKIEWICKIKVNIAWGSLSYRDREVMLPWDKGKILPGWKQSISLDDGIKMFMGCQ